MGDVFTPLDLVLFFAALVGVMAVGLIAGRKEETSEDYFLAGRNVPWWGVAGSIFGSNVSANHMVGMMGIGFSIGFAQSHFELGAIFGLMALCYGFLPVYRKLRVYTLSEYLAHRYDERSRVAYAAIMVAIMALVQMVPGLYIGARSVCVLMGGDALQRVTVSTRAETASDSEERDSTGQDEEPTKTRLNVNEAYYAFFVIALAAIAAGYTIVGGLKAVIWTDVMQSVLLLVASIAVAILTFYRIGGWGQMMALDAASGDEKMHLYLPTEHPDLPWTGVFTGLMALHCFYWGTNQFIVQRALGARSDSQARLGIVAAGFLKLLIPFFAIAAGVAAFYLFRTDLQGRTVDPDAAFSELVKLVIPAGYGIIGVIAAGLIGAILSSIDSMMNSAATIVTVDIYQRYVNPQASERRLILIGRLSIVGFVVLAAVLAIYVLNPNSRENFFLQIVDYQGYLTPGLLVAFLVGMFWPRATGTGSITAILAGVAFSAVVHFGYREWLGTVPNVAAVFGTELNFFHRVFVVILLCIAVHVTVSLLTPPDEQKSRLTWTELGGHRRHDLRNLLLSVLASIVVFAVFGWLMYREMLTPLTAGLAAATWTLVLFTATLYRALVLRRHRSDAPQQPSLLAAFVGDDRFWAGLLCALAVFMHYYFY